jgi:lysozyme family protein
VGALTLSKKSPQQTKGEDMTSNFDMAFEHVVGVEGGYSNDPFDHGGPTNYGITQDTLAAFRGKPVDERDVKNLSLQEAKMIYRSKYWNPLACDQIRSPIVSQILFDQGVNRGISAAAKSIQRAVGVKDDGMIGPKSIEAINSKVDRELAMRFVFDAQEAYARIVQNNTTQAKFLVGWLRRTHKLIEMIVKA